MSHPVRKPVRVQRVDATIAVSYSSLRRDTITVTVTAYADENTSDAVGSGTKSVDVHDTVEMELDIEIPVTRRPFVDVDGETACRLSVEH